ncbi:MAG: DUF6152 family protein [Terriglobales bacterium]
MMRTGRGALIACPILLVLSRPVLAHHSFEAEYDFNKTLTVTGTVTKMEWMNPHAHFYVDVKDASGKVTNWNFELGAIPVLLKQGWRKDSLKVGDQITVEGYLPKDGTKSMANARRVTLPNGKRVFGGSSADVADK